MHSPINLRFSDGYFCVFHVALFVTFLYVYLQYLEGMIRATKSSRISNYYLPAFKQHYKIYILCHFFNNKETRKISFCSSLHESEIVGFIPAFHSALKWTNA